MGGVSTTPAGVVPILVWEPVGTLAPNEYYHVTFRVQRQNGDVVRWIGLDTADTQLIVTDEDAGFMRTDTADERSGMVGDGAVAEGQLLAAGGQGTAGQP